MSWRTVMSDDLLGVRRSRLGQGVAATMFAFTAGIAILVALAHVSSPGGQAPTFDTVMLLVGSLLSVILPFIAMLGSYGAIIQERESGSVRFLLGLPNSRFDAYLGKYCSRSLLLSAATAVGLLVVGAVGFGILREPDAVAFLLFVVATLAFGLLFVGVGLALSAVLDSETQVTTGIISTYVLFRGLWPVMQWGGLYLTRPDGELGIRPYPEWYFYLGRLDPLNAYVKLVNVLFNGDQFHPLITNPQAAEVDYLAVSEWYAVAALAVWLVVVPVVGYLLFVNKDVL
ncbi:ABC transporter permease [Halosimplex pelagicum]|uniref:ABC transporter permease subunit n=1 Tax=Halosimplex pelagicum TaxID=869886 RepID=A0A7D5P7I6_9EURY|nr:ABC transporter permease subunit [Halosimplex pelagicum]QLH82746.1 ABC transporter permease subunit [Halosimplex pelagicum]